MQVVMKVREVFIYTLNTWHLRPFSLERVLNYNTVKAAHIIL